MTDVAYATVEGFIQFDPQTRDVNGQQVTDVTVKTPGADGKLVRITIWPEFQVDVKKGDWLAVDGKLTIGSFEGRDGVARQSVQISATALVTIPGVKKAERSVTNTPSAVPDDLAF